MDPFATSYYNYGPSTHDYVAYHNDAGTGPLAYDRGGTNFPGFNTSPQSWYTTHRASDPGCFTRPGLPVEDPLDLSRFDLLARSAVSNLHVQDVIKPEHNTPWVGPQEHRSQRQPYSRPSLHRIAYAKSEPLLRPDVYSEAADSGYVAHWPGAHPTVNHFSMDTHELEQDYQTLPDHVSPVGGGADNQSTVSDGRLISGSKQRKGKRPLARCPRCGRQPRNLSDSKKHALTHTKPYRCTEPDCTRKDGFATENDLQRHRKSVHNLLPTVGSPAGYVCAACVPEVDTPPKFWPRRDNFKAHIKRKHPNHHEATLIEASKRRLRPGDDRLMHADTQSVRGTMRSAQRSQVDFHESPYEPLRSLGLPSGSLQSQQDGDFGPGSGSTLPNEQALIGHMVDQFGNRPINPTSYVSRSIGGYTNEHAEADFYGNDPGRLLNALSEAAEHLDYSATTSFIATPRRATVHAPSCVSSDLRYKAPAPHGQYPCRYPGCDEVMAHECNVTYGH